MKEENYPTSPGFKTGDTSEESAKRVATRAPVLRDKCLEELQKRDGSADGIASRLCETVLSIRPRISELRRMGLITKSGIRSQNASGHMAIVWTVKKPTTEKPNEP